MCVCACSIIYSPKKGKMYPHLALAVNFGPLFADLCRLRELVLGKWLHVSPTMKATVWLREGTRPQLSDGPETESIRPSLPHRGAGTPLTVNDPLTRVGYRSENKNVN